MKLLQKETLSGVTLSDEEVLKALRLDEDSDEEDIARALELRDEVCRIARPKFLLGEAAVTGCSGGGAFLDGSFFPSPLLEKNLKQVEKVYPFLATCGTEADDWAKSFSADPLEEYWADALLLLLLGKASGALNRKADCLFPGGHMSRMNPGSLPEWPLKGQRDLFALIGEDTLGIRLAESCLMIPHKSVSGLLFHSEDGFVNCAFCRILTCPTRRTAYIGETEDGVLSGGAL